MAKLVGAWHWFILCLKGSKCWACGRPYAVHWPWHVFACKRTPLKLVYLYDQEAVA